MQYRHRSAFFTFGEHIPKTREIPVKCAVFFPPRIALRKHTRVVVSAQAFEYVRVQVLTHKIRAADVLRFRDPTQLVKRDVPTRHREGFRQNVLAPRLFRHRIRLFCKPRARPVPAEKIDPRHLHIFVKRHDVGAAIHLSRKTPLVDRVPRQNAAARFAPIVQLFEIIVRQQVVERRIITETKFFRAVSFEI